MYVWPNLDGRIQPIHFECGRCVNEEIRRLQEDVRCVTLITTQLDVMKKKETAQSRFLRTSSTKAEEVERAPRKGERFISTTEITTAMMIVELTRHKTSAAFR